MSKDPQLIDKIRDVVGLYLDPPEAAMAWTKRVRSRRWTALRRSCRCPARLPAPRTTTSVQAPPAPLRGAEPLLRAVISSLHARHRVIEFKTFLQKIDREVPDQYAVHVVLDNASTHKTSAIKHWLLAHPRLVLHFTPTSSSWLNLVERWFGELTTKKLQRGTHRSVRDLNGDIRDWIKTWIDNPRPYVWTKTADQILDSIARYRTN